MGRRRSKREKKEKLRRKFLGMRNFPRGSGFSDKATLEDFVIADEEENSMPLIEFWKSLCGD